jgi:lipoate-protein ligase A
MDTRLITTDAAAGAWNMSVDEALLEWAGSSGQTCLRFYGWRPATLSLGYFQSVASRQRHAASVGLPIVRRASGGGAIVHDDELTYSFAMPLRDRFATEVQSLVAIFHQSLVDVLGDWGIRAVLCTSRPSNQASEAFLCFQRHTPDDVLIGEHKVAGSAQRRHRRAMLQHGSLLLGGSPHAPELPGIRDLVSQSITANELRSAWAQRLEPHLGLRLSESELTAQDLVRTRVWQRQRFGAATWTNKR